MLEEDICNDWKYYSKTVSVYRVKTAEKTFYITTSQANVLKSIVEDMEHKDRMIFIGDDAIRAFSVLSIIKEKKKFYELPLPLQKKMIEEQEVFTVDEAKEFSKHLKEKLDITKTLYLKG